MLPAHNPRYLLPKTIDKQKVRTVSAQLAIAPEKFLCSLSYNHFELITAIDDDINAPLFLFTEDIRNSSLRGAVELGFTPLKAVSCWWDVTC